MAVERRNAAIVRPPRIAFIGNHLPRRCGIATFTAHLHAAIAQTCPDLHTAVVAMTDHGHSYNYPAAVSFQISDDRLEAYADAASFLNEQRFDAVSLQHEFGIFGGEAGSHILALLSRLRMPVVTTLHTVLAEPTLAQRAVTEKIATASATLIVMAEKGRELLRHVYGVPAEKIEVIAHRIPDVPFLDTHDAKARFGFAGKTVILTFGLLSANKGIEYMIDAMPAIFDPVPTRSMSCWARRIPISSCAKARPIAMGSRRARGNAESRSMSCSSISSSINRHCSTGSRCATCMSRPISAKRR